MFFFNIPLWHFFDLNGHVVTRHETHMNGIDFLICLIIKKREWEMKISFFVTSNIIYIAHMKKQSLKFSSLCSRKLERKKNNNKKLKILFYQQFINVQLNICVYIFFKGEILRVYSKKILITLKYFFFSYSMYMRYTLKPVYI